MSSIIAALCKICYCVKTEYISVLDENWADTTEVKERWKLMQPQKNGKYSP